MVRHRMFGRYRFELAVPDPPEDLGVHEGLSYALFLPPDEPRGGVVILHGAGSQKEAHFDFARACRAAGYAAVAFDQRGHGRTGGELGGEALVDAGRMADLLPSGPLVFRGSSMGGYLAIVAGAALGAAAVVAICPAGDDHLRRLLRDEEERRFAADVPAADAFLAEHPLAEAVAALRGPLLLLHAEGDERIPVEHSAALAELAHVPGSRLVRVPGGHHRSVQHDAELQGVALAWIDRALGHRGAAGA